MSEKRCCLTLTRGVCGNFNARGSDKQNKYTKVEVPRNVTDLRRNVRSCALVGHAVCDGRGLPVSEAARVVRRTEDTTSNVIVSTKSERFLSGPPGRCVWCIAYH